MVGAELRAAYEHKGKAERHEGIHAAKAKALAQFAKSEANPTGTDAAKLGAVFKELEADVVRRNILDTGIRIDGRTVDTVAGVDQAKIYPSVSDIESRKILVVGVLQPAGELDWRVDEVDLPTTRAGARIEHLDGDAKILDRNIVAAVR